MGSRVPTIVQFVLLALAWGASFLFIKPRSSASSWGSCC